MNNEINDKTYIPLTPFKGWVIENFPFIEADFDAITNYELICQVTKYLNEVIHNQNEVQDLASELVQGYNALIDYVNNYFDNLDVTEEINNKLDEMAQDGTLTNLIKNYIDPLINEQNALINQINTKVNAATNGSPLVASSTDEMTDTTKIYVNTTDGNWYYYDGDSWESGGAYQSVGISDGSVTYNNLEYELQNSFIAETVLIEDQIVKDHYIRSDGSTADLNTTQYIAIDVQPYESYKVTIPYSTSGYGVNQPVYIFKYNDSVVSYKKGSEVTITENVFSDIIDIPLGVDELIINMTNTTNIADTAQISKINKYTINNISKEQLDNKLKSIFNDNYTTVTPTLFINNALLQPTYVAGINNYKLYSYSVQPGEKFKVTVKQIYNNPAVAFGNANSSKTYTISGNDYVVQSTLDKIQGESGEQFSNYEFTIPNNCNVIYINKANTDTLTLMKSTSYKVDVDDVDLTEINPLNNKTIMFVGDSICAASTAGVKGWATLIGENNPTATIYNYGENGATIADDGEDTNNVYTKIQTMYTDHPDADYIIIQGGVNDFWKEIPLGTFSQYSNFNAFVPYDTTTFSGALEWIFYYCLKNFGGKKVGFIVTGHTYRANDLYEYMDRAKAICKKWSIPFIDLYEEGDINYLVTEQRAAYSITTVNPEGDGCHPNLAGYEIISPKIENWLKYKI